MMIVRVPRILLFSLLALIWAVARVSEATIYYVAFDGSGADPSGDWSTAATNIQTALDLATVPGDKVCVKQGTYSITSQVEITASQSGVDLLGGYVGTGAPGDRTNEPSRTVIDAEGNCRVIYCDGWSNGALETVTITGGYVTNHGGGVFLTNSYASISNCIIHGNVSDLAWRSGGGVFSYGKDLTIESCQIFNNTATGAKGAAISLEGSGQALIRNCLIYGNTGTRGGGRKGCCIYAYGFVVAIENSTIAYNSPIGVYRDSGTVGITNSIIWKNGDDLVGTISSSYCCIHDGDAGTGNISDDPLFVYGFYLSHSSAGQSTNSPCIDTGSEDVPEWLSGKNTANDGATDTGAVDMGFHYDGKPAGFDRYVSTTGNDGNDGTAADDAHAWRTITNALAVSASNGTPFHIHIAEGTYNEYDGTIATPSYLEGAGPENTVVDAGGSGRVIHVKSMCQPATIEGLTITGGSSGKGGGVFLTNSVGTIRNCIIRDNELVGAWLTGAGLFSEGPDLVIEACQIYSNTALDTASGGSAISLSIARVGDALIRNCLVYGNRASGSGGGNGSAIYIYANGLTAAINCCTIVSNTVRGVYRKTYGTVDVTDSIVWGNGFSNLVGVASSTYSCTGDGAVGDGNISDNPLFVGAGTNNYRLHLYSPCINAGSNQAWMVKGTDLDGSVRIGGGAVDMGAYEFVPPPGIIFIFY